MKKQLNILLVDDDKSVRYLTKHAIQSYISKFPIRINEVENGIEAMQYLSTCEQMPDVILLDIQMPMMDGYDFLEAYSQLLIPSNSSPHIYILSTVTNNLPKELSVKTKGQFEKPLSNEHIQRILLDFNFDIT